jgi:hypothetical protein
MLTKEQIERLEQQGCTAEDWSTVTLTDPSSIAYIHEVNFHGKVKVARLSGNVTYGGFTKHACLRRVTLKNTTVGTNCYICDVHQGISDYNIKRGAYIENVGSIVCPGKSTFGSGVKVSVLPETGGREVMLHCYLSSQEAYLQTYLGHEEVIKKYYYPLIKKVIKQEESTTGTISERCVVVNTGRLCCVSLSAGTVVEGATLLENVGCHGTDIRIGAGVSIKDALLVAGSRVTDGASLTRCFVGSGTVVSHAFTATDCVFASNCHLENGEACSVLAGPYTVSHHKSTLLIGCNMSFFNAGSGTNQSNHAYKLGAHHVGVLQRGCKTASSSHMLLPVHMGAYSMVMGHHKAHFDTTRFPFSYIIEEEGREYLIPAVAATSIGLYRDRAKWPDRDKRVPGEYSNDVISYQLFNPMTISNILSAIQLLEAYKQKHNLDRTYKGLHLTDRAVRKALTLYIAIVSCYFTALIKRHFPKGISNYTDEQIKAILYREDYAVEGVMRPSETGPDETVHISDYMAPGREDRLPWRDFGGLVFPEECLDRFRMLLVSCDFYGDYSYDSLAYWWQTTLPVADELEWIWACRHVLRVCNRRDLENIVKEGAEKFEFLRERIINDGLKEYNSDFHLVGYGVCGAGVPGDYTPEMDFEAVRGSAEKDSFIKKIKEAKDLFDLDPRNNN